MRMVAVPNDPLSWGFAAIAAGAVLWIVVQHCGRFGVRDTVLRLAVIALVGTGTFAVGLETAEHAWPLAGTSQGVDATQAFLG